MENDPLEIKNPQIGPKDSFGECLQGNQKLVYFAKNSN